MTGSADKSRARERVTDSAAGRKLREGEALLRKAFPGRGICCPGGKIAASQGSKTMRNTAIFLLVLGVGAFVLPMIGLQFKILSLFGEATPMVAGGMALVGGIMLFMSMRGGKEAH